MVHTCAHTCARTNAQTCTCTQENRPTRTLHTHQRTCRVCLDDMHSVERLCTLFRSSHVSFNVCCHLMMWSPHVVTTSLMSPPHCPHCDHLFTVATSLTSPPHCGHLMWSPHSLTALHDHLLTVVTSSLGSPHSCHHLTALTSSLWPSHCLHWG